MGFWDIDPATGVTIGVMDDGQHQGMMEESGTTTLVATNPDMAFFLGAEIGAISGLFTLSSLVLAYGEITPALIQQMENLLKQVACSSCPVAKKGRIEPIPIKECKDKVAGMFKKALKGESGPAGIREFCESYQDGFMCSVGLLLDSLRGGPPPEKKDAGAKDQAVVTIGCMEVTPP